MNSYNGEEMAERVAIVGSRDFKNLDAVVEYVKSLPAGTIVVSGGARGVDTVAQETAFACGLQVTVYHPQWGKYGNSAGYRRNELIVNNCDRVVAFWTGKSRGTKHTINIAEKMKKPCEIIRDHKSTNTPIRRSPRRSPIQ